MQRPQLAYVLDPLRRTPKLWVPETWGELFDAYRRVWNLLVDSLDSLAALVVPMPRSVS